jgi:murein L,D-transpeptidase YcbB/YkuD
MSVSVPRFSARRAALGVALAALAVAAAPRAGVADEADRPGVTPLDLSASYSVDTTPTGALAKPETPSDSVSRLDLSPPPGLGIDLPPEAATPASPAVAEKAVAETAPAVAPAAPSAADTAPVAATPPSVATLSAPNASEAAPAAPEAKPDVAPPAAAPPAAVGADAIHAAVDAFLAAKPVGRPIGMGDWEAARRAIADVYAARAYAPLWLEGDGFGERAKAALARLARADEDGLKPPAVPAQADAQADIALSAAVVAYAMQASGARIAPRQLSKDVTASPPVADPAAALRAVSEATDPGAALEAFNPPHAQYAALREALATLRANRLPPSARLLEGPPLKLGMSDPRVPLIRSRFGLGAAPDQSSAQLYDVKVVSAVAAFQRVHGLQPNGLLTAATATALASGGGDTLVERRLLANMEMWRWLPRDLGAVRVEVNVPEFSLKVTSNGEVVHRARVIVGKPDTPTPIFSNTIRYLLVNPAWHVPESIVKKEMAPKLASDPDYLARHGYKVTYAGDKMLVEQPPGEANALGRILFLFPNEHAVYLHDTPQRYLFAQNARALSHGCVRVEDPAGLAELLMGGPKRGWSQDKIRSLLGDKEHTYALSTPVPVHLEYFTEVVNERGAVESRDDLYGLTGKVMAALELTRRD